MVLTRLMQFQVWCQNWAWSHSTKCQEHTEARHCPPQAHRSCGLSKKDCSSGQGRLSATESVFSGKRAKACYLLLKVLPVVCESGVGCFISTLSRYYFIVSWLAPWLKIRRIYIFPLHETCLFLWLLWIFYLSLIFTNLIMLCLAIIFFTFILLDFVEFFESINWHFSSKLEKLLVITFSKNFCSHFFPLFSWNSNMYAWYSLPGNWGCIHFLSLFLLCLNLIVSIAMSFNSLYVFIDHFCIKLIQYNFHFRYCIFR